MKITLTLVLVGFVVFCGVLVLESGADFGFLENGKRGTGKGCILLQQTEGGEKSGTANAPISKNERLEAAAPANKTMALFKYRFQPNTLSIPAGTTVVFENKDPEKHNVTIAALNVDQMIEPGQSWSYTFNTTGEFALTNRLSTNPMNATINVQ